MMFRRFFVVMGAVCVVALGAMSASGMAGATSANVSSVQANDPSPNATGCSPYAHCSFIWSGYKESDTSFTAVSGTWTVPTVQPNSTYENTSTWLGISGHGSSDLIQAGTQEYTNNNKAHYVMWWEVLPADQTNIGTVSPGDTISAQISQNTPGNWTITIKDTTSGLTFSQPESYSGGTFQAEWIEEAPTTIVKCTGTLQTTEPKCQGNPPPKTYSYIDTLPNFGSVTFSNMGATSSSAPTVVATQIAQPNGTVASYPGPITNNSFTITYGSNPPASLTPVGPVPNPPPPAPQTPVLPAGYWLEGQDGGIFAFGTAGYYGSTGGMSLQRPIVGIAAPPDLAGYTLVGSDGGVFAYGSADYTGSVPGLGIGPADAVGPGPHLSAPIVGITLSPTGGGYLMVGADGGVFAFGDATYEGSCPAIGGCVGNVVAVVPVGDGGGYWIVTDQGYVYTFGNADYQGAPGPKTVSAGGGGAPVLNPVVSAAATLDGEGYWILFADGTVNAFGDATNFGSPVGVITSNAARAIVPTADSGGYWVIAANGAVYAYGDATYQGGLNNTALNQPIIAGAGW